MALASSLVSITFMSCEQLAIESVKVTDDYANTVFENAKIYTVDPTNPWAESIAIKDDAIIYIGDSAGVKRLIGTKTKVIDASGKMIMPGLIDSHVHPIWGGSQSVQVNLREAENKEQAQKILLQYRKENPGAQYISGGSWIAANFPKQGPRKEWIDAVISDIPVLLYDHFGHTAWANSKAFELAGLDKNSPDPEGGHLVRDNITGELTGTLRESSAFDLITGIVPNTDEKLEYDSMKVALKYLNSQGITSFVTAYMVGKPLGQVFSQLSENGALTARTMLSFKVSPDMDVDDMLASFTQRRLELELIDSDFISASMAKIFLDGVVLSHTAVMLAPYIGDYKKYDSSPYLYTDKKIQELATGLDLNGFQLHFHTVGDGAARQALDTVEYVNQVNGKRDRRSTISHLFSVEQSDFSRFKSLDVLPNAQFLWAQHNENIEAVEAHIGHDRSQRLYAFGSLKNAGSEFVAGSDWPVSTANPFAAMQIAATRPFNSLNSSAKDAFVNKGDKAGWLSEQKIEDLAFLIRAFTINGARLQYRENSIGSLEVGKLADLIMLDRNIFEHAITELHETQILMTMVGGKVVYQQ